MAEPDLLQEPECDVSWLGHNLPKFEPRELAAMISEQEDFSPAVKEFIEAAYAQFPKDIEEMLAEARALIDDGSGKVRVLALDDISSASKIAALVKRFRDMSKLLDSHREKEKAPYFRATQQIDGTFFALMEKCLRRTKGAKPGAADVLFLIYDDWNKRRLAEEQRKRDEAARIAREEAEEKQRKAAEEARKAEEARLAEERARKPETKEAKGAVAEAAAAAAAAAATEAKIATDAAVGARLNQLAKPADLVRTRHEDGALGTMGTEKYAEVIDESKLDKNALWPFISIGEKEKALRAWAKITGHRTQMEGAEVGEREKSQIR